MSGGDDSDQKELRLSQLIYFGLNPTFYFNLLRPDDLTRQRGTSQTGKSITSFSFLVLCFDTTLELLRPITLYLTEWESDDGSICWLGDN